MKKLLVALTALMLMAGCVHRKPMVVEYYPNGSIKMLDYRKPNGYVTIFGISLF